MSALSRYYDPVFKQRVVEYYLRNKPNVSFRFVGDLFQIKGGHVTVKRWHDRYDGTMASLEQRYRSGRPSKLNIQQVNDLITKVVRSHNHLARAINYNKIANSIKQKTNMNISLRTVRRYGQKSGIKPKKTTKRTYTESKYKSMYSSSPTISLFVSNIFHLYCFQ
jgi:transposase